MDTAAAREPGRFFIWHSAQRHPTLSLDLYSKPVRAIFESPKAVVEGWIFGAPTYDDTLYIKTYAHSMNKAYFHEVENPVIPHCDPQVILAFDHLRDLAELAGLEIEVITVNDVYERLMRGAPVVKRDVDHEIEPISVVTKKKDTPLMKRLFKKFSAGNNIEVTPLSVDELDKSAVVTMSERIAALGETESGAYGFYKVRVDREQMITRYERELVDSVFDRDPQIAEIHDIGAGLGSIAIAVAAKGVRAVMLEYDRRRAAAANVIISNMEKTWPSMAGRLSVAQGSFPETVPKRHKKRGQFAAIATNVMGTLPSEIEDKMIAGLTQYDVVYIDVQRFCVSRKTEDEIDGLLARISAAGLTSQELLVEFGDFGRYYRLAKG